MTNRMWAAVLARAVEDANVPLAKARETMISSEGKMYGNENTPREIDILRARHWLSMNSVDLRMVCAFAGVDHEKVLVRAELLGARVWDKLTKKNPLRPRKTSLQRSPEAAAR